MKPTTTNKDPLIHFPFYINQYQGLLAGYSFLEKGAFIALLCVYLSEDGQIPQEPAKLFRKAGAFGEDEQLALSSVKDEVLRVGLEIIKSQKKIREKSREKASKAAKQRWSAIDAPSNATSIQQAMLEECHTETEKETETEKDININKREELKSQFEEIYRLYNQGKNLKVIPFDKQKAKFQNCLKEISFGELKQNIGDYLKYLTTANWRQKKSFEAWINSSEFFANDWKSEGNQSTGKSLPTQDSFCQSLNQSIGQDLIKSVSDGELVSIRLNGASANDKWDALKQEVKENILAKVKAKFGKETKITF